MRVSRATVYRTLDILVKYNFARKLVLDDGIARYENKLDSKHHDHMICIDTGKIVGVFGKEPPIMTTTISVDIDLAREIYERLISQGWRRTEEVWEKN